MTDPDLIRLFVEPLEEIRAPYMVTGGVASVIYGEPRLTRDVDLVLELGEEMIDRLHARFDTEAFYVPPREALREEADRHRGGHFNVVHRDTSLRADVYLLDDEPLHRWGFANRRRIRVRGTEISVAPVEYVVLRKLEYFRSAGSDRHIRDVAMILRVTGELEDSEELARWIEKLGLEEELQRALDYPM